MNKSRFDLEQELLRIQSVCEDIDLFLEQFYDAPKEMDEDDVWNYVAGIRHVLDLRCNKAWDTFCQLFELDRYNPKEFVE